MVVSIGDRSEKTEVRRNAAVAVASAVLGFLFKVVNYPAYALMAIRKYSRFFFPISKMGICHTPQQSRYQVFFG